MITTKMKRPGGYAHWFNGEGPDIEKDSITCCHCNKIVFIEPLKPIEDFTGWCLQCFKFICLECAEKGTCSPLEKKLEQLERMHR